MLMPGATDTDAALAANVIVRASFDSVIPGKVSTVFGLFFNVNLTYMKIRIDQSIVLCLRFFVFSCMFYCEQLVQR